MTKFNEKTLSHLLMIKIFNKVILRKSLYLFRFHFHLVILNTYNYYDERNLNMNNDETYF